MSSNRQAAEAIIELASRLKSQVTAMRDEYARLPTLIEKEHRAIRAHDLQAVQAVGDDKQALGDRIEACFNGLVHAAQDIAGWTTRLGGEAKDLATLTDCVDGLNALMTLVGDEGLAAKVLKHQVDGLNVVLKELTQLKLKTQPLVEQNKYLLETMLVNYQESYRFWLSLCEETSSAYNSQGQQKSQGRLSGFSARA